ncbi:MAG: acetyl-CoA carboxylase biotin carboxylase subunit [Xanthomonadales bacterium]|nr:acetyl-CoA carboxylase biotin carboxylase subunit [Xanthomonadales bacterium]
MNNQINSILIANRGEIACRVIRSCKKMGIRSIAVYSDADRNAQHVKLADAAIYLGAASAADSYLDISKVIQAAKDSEADAIHPGYGFLSENAGFARALEKNNIIFIGPRADVLELMASKAAAKIAMEKAQVACVPGYHGTAQDNDTLIKAAGEVGYPLLIKASAGGGGKGMRISRESSDFEEALAATRREALRAFGDDQVILERYIERPRHIEVQVFADQHGNVVHLFERDCSSQRRYQKVIEEAPAPNLDENIRNAMYKAAVAATAAVDYSGAGTIEFILSEDGEFWFMEMNTRLQVEHPVTEMLTGIDLVEWQIMVASGEALPLKQPTIQAHGHTIEARLYAEDPDNEFLPAAGVIRKLVQPAQNQSIRFDSGVISGDRISVHYDPMIAKLCVHAKDRNTAIGYLKDALAACWVDGISNNLDFLQRLLASDPFTSGSMHTAWIDHHLTELLEHEDLSRELTIAAAGIFLQQQLQADKQAASPWNTTDNWRIGATATQHILLQYKDQIFEFSTSGTAGRFVIQSASEQTETAVECQLLSLNKNAFQFSLRIGQQDFERKMHCEHNSYCLVAETSRLSFNQLKWQASAEMQLMANTKIVAPMPGNIIEIKVQAGESVNTGDVLVIMEAMKMELSLRAEVSAVVKSVIEQSSGFVDADTLLIELEIETL